MQPPMWVLLAALVVSAVCGSAVITHQGGNESDIINQLLPKPQEGTVEDIIKTLPHDISTTNKEEITESHPDSGKRKKRTICLKCLMGKKLGGFSGGSGGCGGGRGGCGGGMSGIIPVPMPVPVPMYVGGSGGGCGHPGCSSSGRAMPNRGGGCGYGGCGGGGSYQQSAKPVEVVVPVKVTVVPSASGGGGGCATGRCYQPPPRQPTSGGGCPTGGCYQAPPPPPPPRHPPSGGGYPTGGCYQPAPQPVRSQPSGPKQSAQPVEVVVVTVVPSGSGGRGGSRCPTGGCQQMPAPRPPPQYAPSGGGCPMGGCNQPINYQPPGCGGGGCNAQPQVCSTCGGGGAGGGHSYSQASSQASSSSYSWRKK